MGGRKGIDEFSALVNPKNGQLVVSKGEMKKIVLQYCKDTLANNEPEDQYKELIEGKKKKVSSLLNLKDGSFRAKLKTFDKNLKKFKQSRKRGYDFLTKSGREFQIAVFKTCERMFREEKFPMSFNETILHMIFKGKGSREVLGNNRFIHCKPWFPRTAEALIVEDGMKGPLVSGSSIYQIGGQPGHRPEELVFVLKSIIALYRSREKMLLAQCYDVSKFFDKEMIEDAVLVCYKRGVDPKAIRLWYKLNNKTQKPAKI